MDYWVQILKQQPENGNSKRRYALTLNLRLSKDYTKSKINRYIVLLQQRLNNKYGIHLRQLVARKGDEDWGAINHCSDVSRSHVEDKRKAFRRSLGYQVLVFEVTWVR